MVKHGSSTRWSDDREVGDAFFGLHRAQGDEEHKFLDLASKPRSTVLLVWPQNRWLWVSQFMPQNR
jgi:pyrroloquinoline quinone (PQQ) biosynthesis protein C